MRRLIFLILLAWTLPAGAIDTFIIGDIRIEGLQRITPGAVFVALPVRVGDEINDQVSSQSIESLFETGYFDDVRLYREDDVLIVSVVERPTISEVTYEGNKKLKDDVIDNALKLAGLSAGDVYNPELVESFTEELKNAYFEVGHFSVNIFTSVAPLDRNRVELNFTISEGKVALIKEIRLVGNEQISDKEIMKAMELSTKKTLGFLNRNNRYNREQLRADLESISTLYLNQGYIEFSLTSARTFITEDHDGILIVLTMTEGNQYRFGELSITSSEDVIPQEDLNSLVQQPEQEIYSFEEVSETRNSITDSFANIGYGRAQVDALPTIRDDDLTIDVKFVVDPGKLTYVRTIIFRGNFSTEDEVLRREMRVLEGGLYTAREIQLSRNRLNRLGIFENVEIELEPVPGTEDTVDLVVSVSERLTGSLLFGVGYSESQKTSLNFSLSQSNLFGTGKRISTEVAYGDIDQTLRLDYVNPYYTLSGVSRGFNFNYRKRDTSESDSALIYSVDNLSAGLNYSYPVSEEGVVGLAFSATQQEILISDTYLPTTDYEVAEYIGDGLESQNASAVLSYRKDRRNRAFFATEGSDLYLSLTGSAGDEQFLSGTASYAHYFPFANGITLRVSSQVDVGQDLPFHQNYYMTSIAEVRGFASGSLGAKQVCRSVNPPAYGDFADQTQFENTNEVRDSDTNQLLAKVYPGVANDGTVADNWYYPCNSERSLGGNLRLINRAELFFPFFGEDEIEDKRLSIFIDQGNTFYRASGTYATASQELGLRDDASFGNLRSSFGFGLEWLSPIGPFGIHYAIPLQSKPGDDTDNFQITLGTFFD